MAAKKNIIKDLRQEIKDLEEKLKGQKQHMSYRERQFRRAEGDHESYIAMIDSQTNNIARTLTYKFSKELTWMQLCDDPESKFDYIQHAVEVLKRLAAPVERDDG